MHRLIHERCDESNGGFPESGVKRSSGPISRIPGLGFRVAVKVGVVQVEKVTDQMGQGRSV